MSTKLGQARLSQSGGWWVRNTRNKAQLRPAGAGALPELGKKFQIAINLVSPVSTCTLVKDSPRYSKIARNSLKLSEIVGDSPRQSEIVPDSLK